MAPGMIGIPFQSEAGWPSGLSPATASDVEVGSNGVLSHVMAGVGVVRTMEVGVGTKVGFGCLGIEKAERIRANRYSLTTICLCIKPSLFDLEQIIVE